MIARGRNLRRRARTIGTLVVMAGMLTTAAGVQATAASWTDSVEFAATVRSATTTTTTTTSTTTTTTTVAPRPDAFVRVTSICRGPTTYTVRLRNESTVTVEVELRAGAVLVSGPHTIAGGEIQFHEVPNGTNGVRAVPAGDWTNSYQGTASTPNNPCPPPDTTTTSTTTTTTTTTTVPETTTSTTTTTTTTVPPDTTTTTTTTTAPPDTTTTSTTVPPPPSVSSGGVSAANANTVISGIDWTITRARQACTVARVTGIDATPRHWAIRVDLDAPPWNGTAAGQIVLDGTGTITVENPRSVLITGRTRGGGFDPRTNNTPLTSAQTATITICNYNAPVPPPADPSWYTVTTAPGTWTDREACVVVTVTTARNDLASNPFFFGWTATVDLTAAKARITDAGRTLNFVSWSPYPNGATEFWATPESYQPPLDSYTLTSGFNTALRAAGGGADSTTVTTCVHGY